MSSDRLPGPSPFSESTPHGSALPLWQKMIWLCAAFFACAQLSFFLSAHKTSYVSFWLPTGLSVAVLLQNKTRHWLWLMLATLPANLAFDLPHGTPFFTTLLFFLANSVETLTGAWLVRRFSNPYPGLNTLKEFFELVLYAALLGPITGATIGTLAMIWSGMSRSFWPTWETWWSGEALAVFLAAPFILVWGAKRGFHRASFKRPARIFEAALLLGGLIFSTWYIFIADQGILAPYKSRLLPFILWAGLRFGSRGATTANLLFGLLAAFFTSHFLKGLTPAQISGAEYLSTLQSFLVISALVGLIPAIVVGERDQKVQELLENEERFRTLTEGSFEGICISENGHVVDANDLGLKMLGYTRNEAIGQPILGVISPETRKLAAEAIRTGSDAVYEHRLVRRDGGTFLAETRAKMVRLGGRELRITAIRDITERKTMEEALKASESRLRHVLDALPTAAYTCNAQGQIAYFNQNAAQIWGRSPKLFNNEDLFCGSFKLFNLDSNPIPHDQCWTALAIHEQKPVVGRELIVERPDGSRRIVVTHISLLFDAAGKLDGAVNVFTDVTDQRQTEQQQKTLEEQLRQAQKMEALGTLAGGTAHEFNNMLGIILGYSELMKAELAGDHPVQQDIDEILKASQRAKEIVQQVLTFSRQQKQALEPLNLQSVVLDAINQARNTLPATIAIQSAISPDNTTILGNPTQIQQVIINICINAWHAMEPKGGVIKVAQKLVAFDSKSGTTPSLREGSYLQLSITDSGCGMDPATLARIFEPFFTTKGPGKGTGLGLAVVHGIMQSHEGAVLAQSQPGHGTTFHLYFPVHAAATAKAVSSSKAPQSTLSGDGQHILVVDDEPSLLDVTTKLLQRLGYRTTGVRSAAEALAICEQPATAFDLVLTDLTMPEMNGVTLAQSLYQTHPHLPVIMVSGFGGAKTTNENFSPNVRTFLSKPFLPGTLAHTIQEVLVGGPAFASLPQKAAAVEC